MSESADDRIIPKDNANPTYTQTPQPSRRPVVVVPETPLPTVTPISGGLHGADGGAQAVPSCGRTAVRHCADLRVNAANRRTAQQKRRGRPGSTQSVQRRTSRRGSGPNLRHKWTVTCATALLPIRAISCMARQPNVSSGHSSVSAARWFH